MKVRNNYFYGFCYTMNPNGMYIVNSLGHLIDLKVIMHKGPVICWLKVIPLTTRKKGVFLQNIATENFRS